MGRTLLSTRPAQKLRRTRHWLTNRVKSSYLHHVLQPFEVTGRQTGRAADWLEGITAERAAMVKLNMMARLDGEAAAWAYARGGMWPEVRDLGWFTRAA